MITAKELLENPYDIEELFDEIAKKDMIQYDPVKFKKEYKTLFKVIKKTIKVYAEDMIDLAARNATCDCNTNNLLGINKQSILKLKEQIK